MQVTLFKALKSVNIDDAQATAVVDQLEEHLEKMIGDATKGLEAKLDATRIGLEAKLDAQSKQLNFTNVLLGIVGLGVPVAVAIGPAIAKLVH